MPNLSLDTILDDIQVEARYNADGQAGEWWPEGLPWGVSTPNSGIIALFTTEQAACHYRLMLVATFCNPEWSRGF